MKQGAHDRFLGGEDLNIAFYGRLKSHFHVNSQFGLNHVTTPSNSNNGAKGLDPSQDHAGVDSAEAEGVRKYLLGLYLPSMIRDHIENTFRIGSFVVEGRR